MATMQQDEYKFPDEAEDKKDDNVNNEADEQDEALSVEIIDDTPESDRNVAPLDAEAVKELESDDLSNYGKRVRSRMEKLTKVWHDERRAKESADRERQEALTLAQRIMEENKRLKATLTEGEKQFATTIQSAAEMELEVAKRNYRDAYESGDSDRIVEANQRLTEASMKQDKAKNFKPSIREEARETEVPTQQQPVQQYDPRTAAWLSKNSWYGDETKPAMTSLAWGIHVGLTKQYGARYAGTDEYFNRIESEVRKRFPEEFPGDVQTQGEDDKGTQRTGTTRASPVVAPATRSTASKKIVLKSSQVAIAKKLGLTPEQYAHEMQKLEA